MVNSYVSLQLAAKHLKHLRQALLNPFCISRERNNLTTQIRALVSSL